MDYKYKHWIFKLLTFIRSFTYRLTLSKEHRYKQEAADKVLLKLKSFKGDFREARIINYLRKIDPFVFEELLLTALEKAGHEVKRNKRYTADGGIDGVVYRHGKKIYIQAKCYSDHIRLADVNEFIDKVSRHDVQGLFIHTGRTGDGVWKTLLGSRVEIISGNKLVSLITPSN
jgi:restriction system protein